MYNLKFVSACILGTALIVKAACSKVNDRNIDKILDLANLFI